MTHDEMIAELQGLHDETDYPVGDERAMPIHTEAQREAISIAITQIADYDRIVAALEAAIEDNKSAHEHLRLANNALAEAEWERGWLKVEVVSWKNFNKACKADLESARAELAKVTRQRNDLSRAYVKAIGPVVAEPARPGQGVDYSRTHVESMQRGAEDSKKSNKLVGQSEPRF